MHAELIWTQIYVLKQPVDCRGTIFVDFLFVVLSAVAAIDDVAPTCSFESMWNFVKRDDGEKYS